MRRYLSLILVLFAGIQISNAQQFKGNYLGQTPPGDTPELFAPGIISTQYHEHSFPSFSPDGKAILWNIELLGNYIYDFPSKVSIVEMKKNVWTESRYFEAINLSLSSSACFSFDGKKIFFVTDTSGNSNSRNSDIWYIEKESDKWTKPKAVPGFVNTTALENQPSLTKDGTLYFLGHLEGVRNNYGIFKSSFVDGEYQKPEALPSNINSDQLDWTPFIAPDESYLLFSSFREGGNGRGDIWISYRDKNDNWTEPVNLGSKINDVYNERFPYVSPDGKYLFFLSDKVSDELLSKEELSYKEAVQYFSKPGNGQCDIYWVDAKIIEELKPGHLK